MDTLQSPLSEDPPPEPPVKPKTSGLAVASLICGILPIPLLGSLAAIILSIKAKREIERSQGTLTGNGLADVGFYCGVLFGLFVLAGFILPVFLASAKKGSRTEALANAKSIGLALYNFEQDYGSYPSADTAKEVMNNNPDSGLTFGSEYSNDYFRQLIAAGYLDSEKTFYAKTPYTRKPDNVMKGSQCLAAGEVGFGYIMASATEALPSKGNSARPIVVSPLFNASTDGTFDSFDHEGKGVVQRLDNSGAVESIRKSDKKMLIGGGKTLLDSGEGTVWGDVKPVIRAPQKK